LSQQSASKMKLSVCYRPLFERYNSNLTLATIVGW